MMPALGRTPQKVLEVMNVQQLNDMIIINASIIDSYYRWSTFTAVT